MVDWQAESLTQSVVHLHPSDGDGGGGGHKSMTDVYYH